MLMFDITLLDLREKHDAIQLSILIKQSPIMSQKADSERTRIKSFERLCKKRGEKEAIVKNCNVPNPYFFPGSRGIGEVF